MKNEILRTYKFYDKQGRRLSIFGVQEDDDFFNIEIYVITCNKDDNFSKKLVRSSFDEYLLHGDSKKSLIDIHPVKTLVPFIGGKSIYTFMKFCKANFYKKDIMNVSIPVEYLYKPNVFNLNIKSEGC